MVKDYQNLMVKSSRVPNAGPLLLNHHSPITWAICVEKSQTIFKGLGVDAFQEFFSSSFIADIPCDVWDEKAFNNLNNYAVDIIIQLEDCPEFWKLFNPSNNVQVFHKQETSPPTALNHQLFWRGSLRMRDPQNPSNFGLLKHAELSYGFDQLDLLTSQIRGENFPFIATRVTFFICEIYYEATILTTFPSFDRRRRFAHFWNWSTHLMPSVCPSFSMRRLLWC